MYSLSQGLSDDLERYLEHGRPALAVMAGATEQALFLDPKGRRMSAVIRSRLRRYRQKLSERLILSLSRMRADPAADSKRVF